ncbi:MAG: FAD-dependent oxidoreductase [Anaerolineales bacterium]|nr:FAD-dependent oxidoreductase [Anaerolineales bacterium]
MDELIETDVLVIGCGIAGSVTALQLADAGLHVTVVRRCALPGESSTYHAQGGIIYRGKGDSAELLAEDIMQAGDGYCTPVKSIQGFIVDTR